jgi:hypothetical protein
MGRHVPRRPVRRQGQSSTPHVQPVNVHAVISSIL